jgi:hypothetical protein
MLQVSEGGPRRAVGTADLLLRLRGTDRIDPDRGNLYHVRYQDSGLPSNEELRPSRTQEDE